MKLYQYNNSVALLQPYESTVSPQVAASASYRTIRQSSQEPGLSIQKAESLAHGKSSGKHNPTKYAVQVQTDPYVCAGSCPAATYTCLFFSILFEHADRLLFLADFSHNQR